MLADARETPNLGAHSMQHRMVMRCSFQRGAAIRAAKVSACPDMEAVNISSQPIGNQEVQQQVSEKSPQMARVVNTVKMMPGRLLGQSDQS